jgi:hypothetical protein
MVEKNYSWDESFGLSFLRLNKGANVIRQESQVWRLPDCGSCAAEVGGLHRMTIHPQ